MPLVSSLAARVTAAYVAFGLAAVWWRDRTLTAPGVLEGDVFAAAALQGSAIVGVTGVLLFWVVRWQLTGLPDHGAAGDTQPTLVAALRESEARFRELADAIPQIVWTAGPDGRLTHVNARATAYAGQDASALLGRAWDEAVHPDDLPTLMAGRAAGVATGVAGDFEFRLRRADGVYRWHVSRQTARLAPDGSVAAWFGTCTDIEDLKQIQHALRDADARLREAQRVARLGSWRWEPDTNRVWWSDAEFDLFGVDSTAVAPSFEAFLARLHPDDRAVATARVAAMRAGADEFADDLRIVRDDGTTRWIHSRARATRDAEGRLVRVDGIDQDITERRVAEARLREQEMLVREAAELAQVGGWGFDPVTLESDWTPAVARMYGLDPSEPPPLENALAFYSADQRPMLEAALAAAMTDGVPHDLELRLTAADGVTRWVRTICRPIVEEGRVVRVRGSLQDITDRKHIESALQASEQRLRLALEAAGAIAFVWDIPTDTVTRYFSTEPALPVTGPEAGTLDGVRERIYPADLAAFDERLAACLAHGTEYRNEYRLVRANGSMADMEDYGVLTRAADGTPLRLTGMVIDVSRRVAATRALRDSEDRYRRLVSVLPTAVVIHNGQHARYCNPAFMRLVGAASTEEVVARPVFDWVHPDDRDRARHQLVDRPPSGEPAPGVELRLLHRDGRPVPAHGVSAPFTGYGAGAYLLALSDLTDRERASELLRTVLASVNDSIITIDGRGIVQSANPATARQFGYHVDEIVGRNVSLLMPEPTRSQHDGHIAAYQRTGHAKVVGIGREVDAQRRDGSRFPAELTVTEFMLDGERHFTGVLRDISARKRLEDQFRQAQKMEAVGRLAGGVAHDFNNLLTVINGYSEFLLATPLPEDHRESVAAIRDAGERATRLTRQLLAFGRKAILEPKVLDLNDLVAESTRLLQRLLGEDIVIIVNLAPVPVRVKADPSQLEQVIMNLAVNARDAMPTGGRLTIETAWSPTGDGHDGPVARMTVADTGHGMTEEVRRNVFEPFFTTKGVGKGTGLGLAVVDGVIAQGGGGITVESTIDVGTTFRLWLPLVDADGAAADADTMAMAVRGSETILLVEDEDAVRGVVRLALETQGFTVLEAGNGAAALRQAAAHTGHIHLLVSDVVMPEMGGREVLEALRSRRPALRALFMSGYTDDAVLRHGVVDSTDAFIQKPFTPLSLARKVRQVLDDAAS